MKTHTSIAIVTAALCLATGLSAAPDSRKKDKKQHNAPSEQIEKSFDSVARALEEARKQSHEAISQRNTTIRQLQDKNTADEKERKSREANLAEEKKAAELANKEISALKNVAKASQTARQANEKQLAETRQKLEQANKALTAQLKTISDLKKSFQAAEKKNTELENELKKSKDAAKRKNVN